MYVINKYGRLIDIDEADFIPRRGMRIAEFDMFYPEVSYEGKKICLHRQAGGLGDMITILPSVEQVVKKCSVCCLAIPESFFFLFSHIPNLTLLKFEDFETKMFEHKAYFDNIIDLFCPCGIYEYQSGYAPKKGRIENFADALRVEPKAPVLNNFIKNNLFTSDLPKVLFELHAANICKEWPQESFIELFNVLSANNIFVATFDGATSLPGVPAIKDLPIRDVPPYMLNFDLVIGSDSGGMHLAAALGIPTLWLFGPTDASITLPSYKYLLCN